MASEQRGGTHEQHVKAGEQSHKNTGGSSSQGSHSQGSQGTSQSDMKDDMKDQGRGSSQGSHTQGGTHEQHVKAGQQSHKNG